MDLEVPKWINKLHTSQYHTKNTVGNIIVTNKENIESDRRMAGYETTLKFRAERGELVQVLKKNICPDSLRNNKMTLNFK